MYNELSYNIIYLKYSPLYLWYRYLKIKVYVVMVQ